MSSAILFLLNRLRGLSKSARIPPSRALFLVIANFHSTKNGRPPPLPTIFSAIYPLGHPSSDISLELDRWALSGNAVRRVELQHLIRDLRTRHRYKQALQVSEWTKDKWAKGKNGKSFTASNHAVHLDLIGEVHGVSAAKSYFESLAERDKNEKTYGALLNCLVRERLIDESLSHMMKMKEMGLASSPLPYNSIMCLYTNTGHHEKVPSMLEEMKNSKVSPDNFSYRICINSLGAQSDIKGMEKILDEFEGQPQISADWNTYLVAANIYIKAGLNSKAVSMLKKSEHKLEKRNGDCYNHLISLYSALGSKQEMWRLWELQRENCKKFVNRDYTAMLRALVKLQELEEAEALLKDWETSGNFFDFRVPNILLFEYQQRGLMEKAERMLDDFLKKGKMPPSKSWGIIATGYIMKGELKKACEFMINALCVYSPSSEWLPNPDVISRILRYLGEEAEVKMAKNFVGLLKNAVPVNRDIYHTLIKCNLRGGRGLDEVLESMKADGIEPNDETYALITGS